MKVLVVSGIWPPDVGGPASHAPEVAGYLLEHGHEPRVLITADAPPAAAPYPVSWVDRGSPVNDQCHGPMIRARRRRVKVRGRTRAVL